MPVHSSIKVHTAVEFVAEVTAIVTTVTDHGSWHALSIVTRVQIGSASCRFTTQQTPASLRLVSANWRCHTICPLKKTDDIFVIALCKVMTFLAAASSQLLPSDVICPLLFLNSVTKNSFGCHALDGVTRGGTPPPQTPLVTPLTTINPVGWSGASRNIPRDYNSPRLLMHLIPPSATATLTLYPFRMKNERIV